MTCPRFPARAPVAGDGPPSVGRGLVSYGPSRPIRLLVADDDARVRAAIGQTVALEADLVIVADAADGAAALAAGAVAFAEKAGDIDAVLDAVRAAALPHHA
jgi:DNA-binding NarL/FixJ family response regulator